MINKNIERNYALDVIRIVALFFVLFTHTGDIGSKIYYVLDNHNIYYFFCMGLDTIRMVAVPLFLMISGSVLLGKEETLVTVFKKRIMRFVIVLVFFSLVQYGYKTLICHNGDFVMKEYIIGLYKGTIRGEYWYLYLFLAYLLIIPFLRGIASKMTLKLTIYCIILSTIVDCLALSTYLNNNFNSLFYNYLYGINMYSVLFPLLGYGIFIGLQNKRLNCREIVISIICCLGTTIVCTSLVYLEYIKTGIYSEAAIWRFTAILAAPLFAVFLNLFQINYNNVTKKIIVYISDSCFGIYLCENFLEKYTRVVYNICYELTNIKLLSCLIYLVTTIVVGTVIISLIRKIPYISKFI